MKKQLLYILCLWLLCQHSNAQDAMFRGNARHNKNYGGFENMIFNKPLWQFKTGAAIRSSAIVVEHTVYVGSSDGYVYALDSRRGAVKWKYNCNSSISSSPAYSNGMVYVLSEQQELLAIKSANGQLAWKRNIGEDKPYAWGFDYYFSSPVINGDSVLIAGADGKLFSLDKKTGAVYWTFNTGHFIRSSPAVADGIAYIGDTEGNVYAVDSKKGALRWVYHTHGAALNNDTFGFDRRAIISSPVIANDVVVFGGRDGFLYCVDRLTGMLKWTMDHKVSWVISSPSIVGNQVITGTSDGAFVQSVDLSTGKENWRATGSGPVESSPIVVGNYIYVGGNEGSLRCLDLATGKKIAHPFVANAKIFSSPALGDSLLFFGADNGILYCLQARPVQQPSLSRYVYYDAGWGFNFFRNGVDMMVKDYLSRKAYTVINKQALLSMVRDNQHSGKGHVIVFASLQLPREFLVKDSVNILHDFLASGGIAVGLGNNLLAANHDDKGNFTGFDFKRINSIINIPYPENDLRSLGGFFIAQATAKGRELGIKEQWTGNSPVQQKDVDIVLGIDERGRASSWIKKIGSGCFVQLWIDQAFAEDYGFVDAVIGNIEALYDK